MKSTFIYVVICFLLLSGSSWAQVEKKRPRSNYICDSLFNLYTSQWMDWWKYTLKIKGSIPGKVPPAHFIIPQSDLELLDSLGHNGLLPDSVQVFYAFTSVTDFKSNQLTGVLLVNKDTISFNENTGRWKTWAKDHITGEQPVGFKIRFADLDSIYHLLNDKTNPIKYLTGYFGFHSEKDKNLNRMAIIFRPTFTGSQTKVDNNKISCGKKKNTTESKSKDGGKSFINIDFTNPCPPCDTSG